MIRTAHTRPCDPIHWTSPGKTKSVWKGIVGATLESWRVYSNLLLQVVLDKRQFSNRTRSQSRGNEHFDVVLLFHFQRNIVTSVCFVKSGSIRSHLRCLENYPRGSHITRKRERARRNIGSKEFMGLLLKWWGKFLIIRDWNSINYQ